MNFTMEQETILKGKITSALFVENMTSIELVEKIDFPGENKGDKMANAIKILQQLVHQNKICRERDILTKKFYFKLNLD